MPEGPPEVFLRHVSPDGALVWLVNRYRDEAGEFDFAFGFESDGSAWHSHPDAIDAPGLTRVEIVRTVTDDVLRDRLVIKTTRRNGGIVEHALLRGLETEVDYMIDNDEEISLRFWSGRSVTFDELIDGVVPFTPFHG